MSEKLSREDRVVGCLLGGAVGDALGAPVEFLSLAAIRKQYGPDGIRDLEPSLFGPPGRITDDTQMTLFTAEGLLRWLAAGDGEASRDARPFLWRAYLRWLRTQGDDVPSHLHGPAGWLLGIDTLHSPRAPGTTCLGSLQSGEMGTPQRRLNDSKGCGGVMRAAPAGLIGASDPFQLGVDLAAITHSHPSGYLSAGFQARLVHELVAGRPLGEAIDVALDRLRGEAGSSETEAAVQKALSLAEEGAPGSDPGPGSGAAPSPETVERLGGGWVGEEALAIALYCALIHPDDYEAAVLLAVNHSGDTDSTGAITGNIVGALLGRATIPVRWLEELELAETIEAMGQALVARYRPGPEWAERFPGS